MFIWYDWYNFIETSLSVILDESEKIIETAYKEIMCTLQVNMVKSNNT